MTFASMGVEFALQTAQNSFNFKKGMVINMTDQEKYIFISYAHKDSATVVPLIENMKKAGFHIWYDDGIEVGAEWPAYIQSSLEKSSVVLVFISKNSVDSFNCRNEINFALMMHKAMIVVYLEDTELKYGMGLQLNGIQALSMFKYAKASDFFEELTETALLQICREGHERLSSAFVEESDFGLGFGHHPEHIVQDTVTVNALLTRVTLFLEDSEWDKADEFCEQILNRDPKNAEAYLGKLMAELHISQREDLKNCENSFETKNNYKKILRFGDAQLKQELENAIQWINKRKETESFEIIYEDAVAAMKSAKTESEYKQAAEMFLPIASYKDSLILKSNCLAKAEEIRKDAIYYTLKNQMNTNNAAQLEDVIQKFKTISGWRDVDDHIRICREKIQKTQATERLQAENARKNMVYESAKNKMNSNDAAQLEEVVRIFQTISGWRDSDENIRICREKIEKIRKTQKDEWLKAENTRKDTVYESAKNKMNTNDIAQLEEAIQKFRSISGWRDSENHIRTCFARIDVIKKKSEEEILEQASEETIHIENEELDTQKNNAWTILLSWILCASMVFATVSSIVERYRVNMLYDLYFSTENDTTEAEDGVFVLTGNGMVSVYEKNTVSAFAMAVSTSSVDEFYIDNGKKSEDVIAESLENSVVIV